MYIPYFPQYEPPLVLAVRPLLWQLAKQDWLKKIQKKRATAPIAGNMVIAYFSKNKTCFLILWS